jgi:hypothetical protein
VGKKKKVQKGVEKIIESHGGERVKGKKTPTFDMTQAVEKEKKKAEEKKNNGG